MDDATSAERAPSSLKAALPWVAIIGLLGLVAWLVSERNARSWFLVPSNGQLVVKRGMMFPIGTRAFSSSDPVLAQAYAPIAPPPGKPLPSERSFEERGLLDQAIYEVVAGWARDEIESGEPSRLERGLAYIARADRLTGISISQREGLSVLRAESAYQNGMRLLSRGVDDLREATEELRRASSSRSQHAAAAGRLLEDVAPVVESVSVALRRRGEAKPPEAAQPQAAPPAEPAH